MTHNSQELGNGLADVLFGDYNPSARLTQTWPASLEQLPPMMDYDLRHGRTYMYSQAVPQYAFGYGLSYTRFTYANLRTGAERVKAGGTIDVSVDVTNAGASGRRRGRPALCPLSGIEGRSAAQTTARLRPRDAGARRDQGGHVEAGGRRPRLLGCHHARMGRRTRPCRADGGTVVGRRGSDDEADRGGDDGETTCFCIGADALTLVVGWPSSCALALTASAPLTGAHRRPRPARRRRCDSTNSSTSRCPGSTSCSRTTTTPRGTRAASGIIQNGLRVATNGDIRLDRTPGQWQPVPKVGKRVVDRATGEVSLRAEYPDEAKNRKGFNPVDYPDLRFAYTVRVRPEGKAFRILVDLEQPLPDEWIGRVSFNMELFPGLLFGKAFATENENGIFPRQANGPGTLDAKGEYHVAALAKGKRLVIAPESDRQRMTIEDVEGRRARTRGRPRSAQQRLVRGALARGERRHDRAPWSGWSLRMPSRTGKPARPSRCRRSATTRSSRSGRLSNSTPGTRGGRRSSCRASPKPARSNRRCAPSRSRGAASSATTTCASTSRPSRNPACTS